MASKNIREECDDDLIDRFSSVTGASRDTSKHYVEACNGNINAAVEMFLESGNSNGNHSSQLNNQAELSNDSSAASSSGACGSNGPVDGDDVRAPIPQKMEKLVDQQPQYNYSRKRTHNMVFDPFRDFQFEADSFTKQDDEPLRSDGGSTRSLQELFRPPLELVFRGSFDAAKAKGQRKNKWLMVNIQNMQEFPCLALNRDIWSNKMVKEIVKEHFVLWQVCSDSYHGSKYMQFYKVNDWPYVSFLDPRTGEKLVETDTLDVNVFLALVREFLDEQGSPMTSDDPPTNKKRKIREDSILEASEEAQLRLAMLASMKEGRDELSDDDDDDDEDGGVEGDDDDEIVISDVDTVTLSDMSGDEDVQIYTKNTVSKGSSSKNSALGNTEKSKNKSKNCKNKSIISKNKSFSSSNHTSESASPTKPKCHFKDFLGSHTDISNLVLRLPDGTRKIVSWPCDSRVAILCAYVSELGYDVSKVEFVTCYPKRLIDVSAGERNAENREQDVHLEGREGSASCSGSNRGAEDSGVGSSGSSVSSRGEASSSASGGAGSSSGEGGSGSSSSSGSGEGSGGGGGGSSGSSGNGGRWMSLKEAGLYPKETIFVQLI